jgi:hypothetical protein
MLIPIVENFQKGIQSLCNFSFFKIVKIEPANKVQSFPSRYGSIQHGTIFFYLKKKSLKKFFVLSTLSSNEKNSSDHHNSYK